MTDIADVFYPSEKLREIVESRGWTLYEITDSSEGNEPADLEKRGPAKGYFRFGRDYMFMPIPEEGETLEEAANKVMFEQKQGPALDIQGTIIPFTRIEFGRDMARVCSPPPLHPGAEFSYNGDYFIKIFENCFFIQTPGRRQKYDPRMN